MWGFLEVLPWKYVNTTKFYNVEFFYLRRWMIMGVYQPYPCCYRQKFYDGVLFDLSINYGIYNRNMKTIADLFQYGIHVVGCGTSHLA